MIAMKAKKKMNDVKLWSYIMFIIRSWYKIHAIRTCAEGRNSHFI